MPTLTSHVWEKQITLNEKPRNEKNSLKLSKFSLMFLIFKWSIENESWQEPIIYMAGQGSGFLN